MMESRGRARSRAGRGTRRRRSAVSRALIGAGALVLAAATIGSVSGAARGSPASEAVELVEVGKFVQPVYVTSAPGRAHLLFVVERRGTVRVLRNGVLLGKPFLNIKHRVESSYGENGLLSIAFMPGSRFFYAFYTNRSGKSEIDEFMVKQGRPTQVIQGSRREVLEIARTANTHNGGQLQFGPDDLLYISTGDSGVAGDPFENAQNPDTLLGKILRIDPRPQASQPYGIPDGNPFVGADGLDEIYALGLRNPWRFSFDRKTGAIAIADVGQDSWEEVDYEAQGEAKGANFGWDDYEGDHPFEAQSPPPNYAAPIYEYAHVGSAPCWSITGGYVVRDPDLKSLEGRYVYGDFCSGELRSLVPDPGGEVDDAPLGLTVPNVDSFGEGPDGQLYAVSISGPVYRLEEGP